MRVELAPAEEADEQILVNLLQLYLHDLSEFEPIEPSPDAEFRYPYLSHYWVEPGRYAFFIMVNDELAGFAFVRSGSDLVGDDWAMELAEFFILRSFRHKGVGRTAAFNLLAKFPGPWVVGVIEGNVGAVSFWDHVIPAFTHQTFQRDPVSAGDRNWVVYQFEAPGSIMDRASG